MDEFKKAAAEKIFNTICETFDTRQWKYSTNAEDWYVHISLQGDGIPYEFVLFADAPREVIRLLCFFPDKFDVDRRVDGAMACCAATYAIDDGSFDFNLKAGSVLFRMAYSYKSSVLGKEVIEHMADYGIATVDKVFTELSSLCKGYMSLTEFLEKYR